MEDFKLILDGLYKILYKNGKSTDIINEISKNIEDISYITKNIYGVLENKLYLEYILKKLSKIKLNKLDKNVKIILLIGLYNIHFLDRKNYAIVNELVNLTKKVSFRSKSYVNAILRSFIRDEENLAKINIKNEDEYRSIKYSMPLWIIKYLNDSYGKAYTDNFLKSLNKERNLSIRINKTKTDKANLKKLLKDCGYILEDSKISDSSLIIKNPKGLAKTAEFENGLFTIQSEGSTKVCEILNPRKNSNILDICAAPGTKTSFLAELCENSSKIIANDISFNKLSKINENIDRLGLKNIEITNFDASILKEEYKEKFDYILCDLPCSGLGVIDRKPEIRYNRTMEDVKNLSKLQKNILDKAFLYLKPGGKLVFSTCTIGNIENRDNFTYLSKKKRLKNIKINKKEYIEYNSFEDETDGFFITKFEKI